MFILIDFSRKGMVTFHDTLENVKNMLSLSLEAKSRDHIQNNFWVYNLENLNEVIFEIDEESNIYFKEEE